MHLHSDAGSPSDAQSQSCIPVTFLPAVLLALSESVSTEGFLSLPNRNCRKWCMQLLAALFLSLSIFSLPW